MEMEMVMGMGPRYRCIAVGYKLRYRAVTEPLQSRAHSSTPYRESTASTVSTTAASKA